MAPAPQAQPKAPPGPPPGPPPSQSLPPAALLPTLWLNAQGEYDIPEARQVLRAHAQWWQTNGQPGLAYQRLIDELGEAGHRQWSQLTEPGAELKWVVLDGIYYLAPNIQ